MEVGKKMQAFNLAYSSLHIVGLFNDEQNHVPE